MTKEEVMKYEAAKAEMEMKSKTEMKTGM